MAAMMLLGLMSFTACGDDDDETIDDIIEKIDNGNLKATVKIAGDNPMVLTAEWKGIATEVHTATFNADESLKSYIIVMTYANSKLADEEWNGIVEDGKEDPEWFACYSREGNVLTYDGTKNILEDISEEMDDENQDMTHKQLFKLYFEMLKQEYTSGRQDY